MMMAAFLALPGSSMAGEIGESLNFGDSGFGFRAVIINPAQSGAVFTSRVSRPAAEPYDTLAMEGRMSDPGLAAEARSGDGDWQAMTVKHFDGGRFWAKIRFPSASANPVQIRLLNAGLKGKCEVAVYDVEVFEDKGELKDDGGALPEPPPSARLSAPPAIPGLSFVSRSAWKAEPPNGSYTGQTPSRVTLHHTAGHQPMNRADGIKEMRFLQDYHKNVRHWTDIAYHFVIDGEGTIYQGRPINAQGAHVLNNNANNAGVSVMGNFMDGPPTKAQLKAVETALTQIAKFYKIGVKKIYAHREIGSSDCPGNVLYDKFLDIRSTLNVKGDAQPDTEAAPRVLLEKAPGSDAVPLGLKNAGQLDYLFRRNVW